MDNNDIITQIALHLDVNTIKTLYIVNHNYNKLLNDNYFWYLLTERKYPGIPYYVYKDIYLDIDAIERLIYRFTYGRR